MVIGNYQFFEVFMFFVFFFGFREVNSHVTKKGAIGLQRPKPCWRLRKEQQKPFYNWLMMSKKAVYTIQIWRSYVSSISS